MSEKLSWRQRIKVLLTGKMDSALSNTSNKPDDIIAQYNSDQSAKKLLAILQKKGRFIDFINQDIDHFSDDEVAAAARMVHQGCQRVLKEHCKLSAIRTEDENSDITLEQNFDRYSIHLTGNIQNQHTFKGVLVHKGWKIDTIRLPNTTQSANPNILQPAEIEVV